uniref:DUF4238 domain-containing protein n=1 Tax=Pseudomonas aeruginosa TaxID=287 RepID=UPI003CE9ECCD
MARHHYVPQFLLKKWLNKGFFYYYALENNIAREFTPNSTQKIFAKKNLYQAFEKIHFAKIDALGSSIIRILENNTYLNECIFLDNKLLSKEDKNNFAMFVISLTGRHP